MKNLKIRTRFIILLIIILPIILANSIVLYVIAKNQLFNQLYQRGTLSSKLYAHQIEIINKNDPSIILKDLDLNKLIEKIGKSSQSFLLSRNGDYLNHTDKSFIIKYPKAKSIQDNPENGIKGWESAINQILIDIEKSYSSKKSISGISNITWNYIDIKIFYSTLPTSNTALVTIIDEKEVLKPFLEGIQTTTIVGVSLTILIFVIVIWLVSKSIIKPIKIITNRLKDISEGQGDLNKTVNYQSNDEIGELSMHFDNFIHKLRDIINNIKRLAGDSLDLGKHLSSHTEKTSTSYFMINKNIKSINEIAPSLNENLNQLMNNQKIVSVNIKSQSDEINAQKVVIEQSSAAITQMVHSINNISSISKEQKSATQHLIKIIHLGEQKVRDTNHIITQISKTSEEIIEMIKLINDIATKTNLLAMNAAIEAAHAGSSGRGFAVVADEIRKLAISTASNVNEISNTLKGSVEKIKLATEYSEESSGTFDKINQEMSRVTTVLDEVLNGMYEIDQASHDILKGVARLQDVTHTVMNNAENIKNIVKDNSEITQNMKSITVKALQNIDYISSNSDHIKSDSLVLADLGQKNIQFINELNNKTSLFITDIQHVNIHESIKESTTEDDSSNNKNDLIEWDQSFSVKIKSIDIQHKKLIDLINMLYRAMTKGGGKKIVTEVLNGLIDYAAKHFSYEEKLMSENEYPGLHQQMEEHKEFVKKINIMSTNLSIGSENLVEIMIFLQDWLVDHIKGIDMQYSDYLNNRGIE